MALVNERFQFAAMARTFIERCHAENIDLLLTSIYRDVECRRNFMHKAGLRQVKSSLMSNQVSHLTAGAWHSMSIPFGMASQYGVLPANMEHSLRVGAIGEPIGLDWADGGENSASFLIFSIQVASPWRILMLAFKLIKPATNIVISVSSDLVQVKSVLR